MKTTNSNTTALKIPTSPEKIYTHVLGILSPLFQLSPTEIKVVAKFLDEYKKTEGANEEVRWGYVFSTETRKKVREHLKMNTNAFNLTISALRKKKLFNSTVIEENDGTKSLNKLLVLIDIDKDLGHTVIIKFVIPQANTTTLTTEAKPKKSPNVQEIREDFPIPSPEDNVVEAVDSKIAEFTGANVVRVNQLDKNLEDSKPAVDNTTVVDGETQHEYAERMRKEYGMEV